MFRISEVGKCVLGGVATTLFFAVFMPLIYRSAQAIPAYIGGLFAIFALIAVLSVAFQWMAQSLESKGYRLASEIVSYSVVVPAVALLIFIEDATKLKGMFHFGIGFCLIYPNLLQKAIAKDKAKQLAPATK